MNLLAEEDKQNKFMIKDVAGCRYDSFVNTASGMVGEGEELVSL